MNVFSNIIFNLLACIDWFVSAFVRPLIDKIFDNVFLSVFAVFGFGTTILFAVIWLINYFSDITAESQYNSSLVIANNDKYYSRTKLNEAKSERRYQERKRQNQLEAEERYKMRKEENQLEAEERYRKRKEENKAERFPQGQEFDISELKDNYFKMFPNAISFSYNGQTVYNTKLLNEIASYSNTEKKKFFEEQIKYLMQQGIIREEAISIIKANASNGLFYADDNEFVLNNF